MGDSAGAAAAAATPQLAATAMIRSFMSSPLRVDYLRLFGIARDPANLRALQALICQFFCA
jgi:hypothetical protein